MNHMNQKFLLFSFLFLSQVYFSNAQEIPIGTWRTHLSYQNVQNIALAEDRVYAASENGLFYYDIPTGSLEIITTIEGLSETEITALRYHQATESLLIGYDNGNIDILQNNELQNLPTLSISEQSGEKRIQHITFKDNFAYLSTPIGLFEVDIIRREIRSSFQNIAAGGNQVNIFASAFANDSLFVATSGGILRAAFNQNLNLQDFQNWEVFDGSSGIPSGAIQFLASVNDSIFIGVENDGIYAYDFRNQWSQLSNVSITSLNFLKNDREQLIIGTGNTVLFRDGNAVFSSISNDLFNQIQDFESDGEGTFWFGDSQNGLVRNQNTNFEYFFPNGTANEAVWSLSIIQNNLIVSSGGYTATSTLNPLNRNFGFYEFSEGTWTNFNAFDNLNAQPSPLASDLVDAVFDANNGLLYLASFQNGLLIRDSQNNFELISSSPLRSSSDATIRVSAFALDRSNSLWLCNPNTSGQVIHRRQTDGTSQSFTAVNANFLDPIDILVEQFTEYKWILANPNSISEIWVLDSEQNRSRLLDTDFDNGNINGSKILCFEQDLEGQIWIGTDEGISVFVNPSEVFSSNFNATSPIFDARPLLRSEEVNAITIDGGNRKWIATNNGAWLFNPDGTELVYNFNEDNSPLLSDIVVDIAVLPETGEVFFATDKGIISFRGDATIAQSSFQTVEVFPNPVRPDFTGLVGISGLAESATVKITDISGKLIFETQANGGTATWDVQDYNGQRAKTGIYLVFSTNVEGSETLVSKIAVIE